MKPFRSPPAEDHVSAIDPAALGRRIVVLSPHLDDAVFSIGATIARAARSGAQVSVVTVFGGDPQASAPAGLWDRRAGFLTAGEAAAARRREDRKACAILKTNPLWKSFPDNQYAGDVDAASIASALEEVLRGVDTLLLPGFPLSHGDHSRLSRLVLESALFGGNIYLYVELPYALWAARPEVAQPLRELVPDELKWRPTRVSLRDVVLKVRATRAYSTQLGGFGEPILWRMLRYEALSPRVLAEVRAP